MQTCAVERGNTSVLGGGGEEKELEQKTFFIFFGNQFKLLLYTSTSQF